MTVDSATRLLTPRSDDTVAAGPPLLIRNKCPLSSQLIPISKGHSPICHLGRRLVAGSSAATPVVNFFSPNFLHPFGVVTVIIHNTHCNTLDVCMVIVYSHGKTTLLKHISTRVLNIPPNIDLLLCEQGRCYYSVKPSLLTCWSSIDTRRWVSVPWPVLTVPDVTNDSYIISQLSLGENRCNYDKGFSLPRWRCR